MRPALLQALAALLLATLAGPAAAQADAPTSETVRRLSEAWRWRTLSGEHTRLGPTFMAAGPRNSLIAMAPTSIGIYDGYAWKVPDAWTALPIAMEHTWYRSAHAVDNGLVVITGAGVFGMTPDGEYRRLDDGENYRDWSPGVSLRDGTVIVAVRDSLQRADALGLTPWMDGPPDAGRIFGVAVCSNDDLWASAEAGLFRYHDGEWSAQTLPAGTNPDDRYSFMRTNGSDVLMLGNFSNGEPCGLLKTEEQGLTRLDPREISAMTHALLTDDGVVILATRDKGLRVFEDGHWFEVTPPEDIDAYILALCKLENGRLIVSEASGSMSVCNLQSDAWASIDTDRDVDGPAPIGGTVRALALSQRGGLWVGGVHGLARWNGTAFVDSPAHGSADANMLSRISALHEDGDGVLWAGSSTNFLGLCTWDGDAWQRVRDVPGLSDQHVDRILPAWDGGVWVLTTGDDYMVATPPTLMRWTGREWHGFGEPEGLPKGRCWDLVTDADGSVTVATMRGLFTRPAGQATWHPVDAPAPHDGQFKRLLMDVDQNLWVASDRRGGGVFVRRRGEWHEIFDGRGLTISASALISGHTGQMWCAGPSGLYVIHDDRAHPLTTAPTANFESALADGAGGLWLGTIGRGLLHHRPMDDSPPRTFDLVANPQERDGAYLVTWDGADAWNETPGRFLHFQYRAGGGLWSATQRERRVVLHDLPYGEQSVQVRAIDSAGNVEPVAAQVAIDVPLSPWLGPGGTIAAGLALALLGALLIVSIRRRKERRDARLALLASQEAERGRFSRELHDNLGQLLTALGLHLERASGDQIDPERRAAALREALRCCRETQDRVREVSTMMRPQVLDDHGLPQAIDSTLDEFSRTAEVAVITHVEVGTAEIPKDAAVNIFRILQEALTNVARHAEATTVHVTLVKTGPRLELTVKDDGLGFDTASGVHSTHIGLLGMNERAHLFGGHCQVRSTPGNGTTVHAVFVPGSVKSPVSGS